jgi:uncharacterized protein (DUF1697 family)
MGGFAMAVYIAWLRGINVGGKNMIKMPLLKAALETLGLSGVQTYIQSGNVVFASNEDEDALCARIEAKIKETFGFAVPVILRTDAELTGLLADCPYTAEEIEKAEKVSGVESLYAAFFRDAPPTGLSARLETLAGDADRFALRGRDVYLLFSHSIRDSRLAAAMQKTDAPPTVRNFNTIRKLLDLAAALR